MCQPGSPASGCSVWGSSLFVPPESRCLSNICYRNNLSRKDCRDNYCQENIYLRSFPPMATATGKTKAGRNGSKPDRPSDPHREAWTALCRAHAGVTGRLQEALTEG